MNTEIISILAGAVIVPMLQVMKSKVKMTRTESYAVTFLSCLAFTIGFQMMQPNFRWSELFTNFSQVLATSQLVYGLVVKNIEKEPVKRGKKK